VHLEGTPAEIGYQHGFLLAPEIAERISPLNSRHSRIKDWAFSARSGESFLAKIETEYRQNCKGIVDGLAAKGATLISGYVATNAWLELDPYYVKWVDRAPRGSRLTIAAPSSPPAATHMTASPYRPTTIDRLCDRLALNIILISRRARHRFIMDGMPGLIHSGDDFGINSSGIMITETTISQFHRLRSERESEFVRAPRRCSIQLPSTIRADHEGRE